MRAIHNKHLEVVKALLEAGANVNLQDEVSICEYNILMVDRS